MLGALAPCVPYYLDSSDRLITTDSFILFNNRTFIVHLDYTRTENLTVDLNFMDFSLLIRRGLVPPATAVSEDRS